MMLHMLKSKIHRARVTHTRIDYEGSLTLDPLLMEAAGLLPFERVWVYNITNGERFDTYVIEGEEAGSGTVCLNGAAARKGEPGDLVIICSYGLCDESKLESGQSIIVLVDPENRVTKRAAVPWKKSASSS